MNTEAGKDQGKSNRNQLTVGACAFLMGAAVGLVGTVLYATACSSNMVKCSPASSPGSTHCHPRNPFGRQCHGDETYIGSC